MFKINTVATLREILGEKPTIMLISAHTLSNSIALTKSDHIIKGKYNDKLATKLKQIYPISDIVAHQIVTLSAELQLWESAKCINKRPLSDLLLDFDTILLASTNHA